MPISDLYWYKNWRFIYYRETSHMEHNVQIHSMILTKRSWISMRFRIDCTKLKFYYRKRHKENVKRQINRLTVTNVSWPIAIVSVNIAFKKGDLESMSYRKRFTYIDFRHASKLLRQCLEPRGYYVSNFYSVTNRFSN